MLSQPAYTLAPTDQFLLFGDSITQQCFSPNTAFSFGAALADTYVRRLDIVNHGLSGYNTTQALQALPLCMPEPEVTKVRFMTIFFGANDARIAGSPGGPSQTVPLNEFKRNIKAMIQSPSVVAHEDIRIILITTPPIDERTLSQTDHEKYEHLPRNTLRRTAAHTATYAEAVRSLGVELDIPVCDIHTAMIARAGYSRSASISSDPTSSSTSTTTRRPSASTSRYPANPSNASSSSTTATIITTATSVIASPTPGSLDSPENPTLQSFFTDGLHFSGEGYRVLFGEVMSLIEETWPSQMPARLPLRLPPWDLRPAWQTAGEDLPETRRESGHRQFAGGGGSPGDEEGMRVEGTFEAVVREVRRRA
ncbi:hypothetical protein LTR78_008133 [Recurvomyces mirabilis]|uniref:SGNH hydrolase-type esterase domain-containing protein n=1 Tax=Recurvomyces mirabilis TaxID=574656 RepID=A0AAE0TTI1_9PEZI|nr:hypothetical protein LTR78_008133 [Recurvomyces mirabilis]KAK5150666.1 hypothetical protein LTS14_009949 [Recurvomyces mirabilis]